MAWTYFGLAVIGLLFTLNAYRPTQYWLAIAPSFFGAWLTNELAPWHLAWQFAATIAFGAAGAFDALPGRIGLGLTFVSWLGLANLIRLSQRAHAVFDRALHEVPDTTPPARVSVAHLLAPFWLRDRRVERIVDIEYAPDFKRRHHLDVWRARPGRGAAPIRGGSGAPVLLQIHGGAWIIGNKNQQGRPLMLAAARHGWVCVASNYRLSPKATFPDHLVDVKLAIAWIKEHIHEYGGDPDRIVVTGGSAGAHLAAFSALSINEPAYQPGFETVSTHVVGCVPLYGVYDFVAQFDLPRPRDRRMAEYVAKLVMKQLITEARPAYEAASPQYRVANTAPPFLVIHGNRDNIAAVEQARRFSTALRATSLEPVFYAELPGATHAFDVFHSLRTEHTVHAVLRFADWLVARSNVTEPGTRDEDLSRGSGGEIPSAGGTPPNDPTTTARTAP
jgi:acetyl esterase/lipase